MKCLLVFVFAAALCATGEALKCYQCSTTSPSCNDPFDKSGAGVSEEQFGSSCLCAKIVLLLNGKTTTERTCMSVSAWTAKSQASRSSSDNLSVNFCDTDLCNGATAAQITLALLAAPLIFMLWQ